MSVKSLLQAILFFLILLIIGGIYFIYFYPNIQNVDIIKSNELEINKSIDDGQLLSRDKEESNKINNKENEIFKSNAKNKSTQSKHVNDKNKDLKNITKYIEYLTTDKNGNKYQILAKYGSTNAKNKNILDLKEVQGKITSSKKPDINIKSNYAKYDYNNQKSEFYDDVVISFNNKEINCDIFLLDSNQNIAVAYKNVIVKSDNSVMKAEKIIFDIITKDININSNDSTNIKLQ